MIELIKECGKPLIGHNMIYDIGFMFRQFISGTGNLPDTFPEFIRAWKEHFKQAVYDSKVFGNFCGTGLIGKTDLHTVYTSCMKEKKLRNNVMVDYDKKRDKLFGNFANGKA